MLLILKLYFASIDIIVVKYALVLRRCGDHLFYVLTCYGQSSGSSFLSLTWQKLKASQVHIPKL